MHWQNDTIVAGLMSGCVFLLFSLIKKPGKCYSLVRKVSEASYGMYLMHMLMLPAVFRLLNPLTESGFLTSDYYRGCHAVFRLFSSLFAKTSYFP